MSVDEVIERSTVKFERPLSLDGVRELFKHIAMDIHGLVECSVKSFEGVVYDADVDCCMESVGSFEISGRVEVGEYAHLLSTALFMCKSSFYTNNAVFAEELNFNTIPGYRLGEHNPEEVNVWDSVRGIVREYFRQKKDVLGE